MMNLIMFLFLIIMILLSIAFFTLLERKIMGYSQIRKGPNKTSISGILQPISDAFKLFSKEMNFMFYMNMIIYMISPILSISMMLLMWMIFFFKNGTMMMNLTLIFFLCISSMSSYSILMGGWASNSKYSLIGAYRGFAQIISYEVSMAMLLIGLSMFCESFSINNFILIQENFQFVFPFLVIFVMWMIILLAESNRTPFDFSEGESELVSGFNIEYGSWLFALIFMSEYGMMIVMSMLTSYMFFSMLLINNFITLMIMSFFIIIRSTFARFRYDKLMMMAWKTLLPMIIFFLFVSMFMFQMILHFFCINFWNLNPKSNCNNENVSCFKFTLFK
uniref:NADH-ubiquinone oxidoreductase chain 1 n=1 Tax=Amblyomma triguttatum TaxID=65637 RepID=Q6I7M5_9ACAR|nr:NADH dehydrogenase subunit 1 [Amblyomma triguttatum]BAD24958.1 NADH dehydrogenase subunit 1 [Amblyomma triguttatum]